MAKPKLHELLAVEGDLKGANQKIAQASWPRLPMPYPCRTAQARL